MDVFLLFDRFSDVPISDILLHSKIPYQSAFPNVVLNTSYGQLFIAYPAEKLWLAEEKNVPGKTCTIFVFLPHC